MVKLTQTSLHLLIHQDKQDKTENNQLQGDLRQLPFLNSVHPQPATSLQDSLTATKSL
jgi:hypothetical protein